MSRMKFIADTYEDTLYTPIDKAEGRARAVEILRVIQNLNKDGWVNILTYNEKEHYWKVICVKEGETSKVFEFTKRDFRGLTRNPDEATEVNDLLYAFIDSGNKVINALIRCANE